MNEFRTVGVFLRHNWKRLSPFLLLIAAVGVFLLVGWLSMFPPGPAFAYPVRQLYNVMGVWVLRVTSVICLGALPVALLFIFWALRRFTQQEMWQSDTQIAWGLVLILFMVMVYLVPLVISLYLLPDFTYPGRIASAQTDSHQYYVDLNDGSETDMFYLSECDLRGIFCEHIFVIEGNARNGWTRGLFLRAEGDQLRVESGPRTIHIHIPE